MTYETNNLNQNTLEIRQNIYQELDKLVPHDKKQKTA